MSTKSMTYRSTESALRTLKASNAGPCCVWICPNMGGAVSTSYVYYFDGVELRRPPAASRNWN